MNTLLSTRRLIQGAALLGGAISLFGGSAQAQTFTPGNLVVSRSVYSGTASTVTIGQTLPGGGKAVADGSYPNVFKNEAVDGSFGVTSAIYLDQITTTGTHVNTYDVPTSQLVTSFPSKSELGLNLSTDGKSLTFMGYTAPVNALDISNTNTPGVIEPGNPVTTTPTYRAVYQLNADGSSSVTTTNAYSGNNGRNAIMDSANNQYFTVGNAGNGSGAPGVTSGTGVQIITPGQNATAATPGLTQAGFYSITENGYKADKTAKDNNFRGETIFNNTLYVTKGSGSNGIDTVYQVGPAGTLPTAANASGAIISVLPGFDTTLAKTNANSPSTNFHPFGLFFANATTLYVADEGDGTAANAGTTNDPHAGLEKWSFDTNAGQWNLDYTLTSGLNLGQSYNVTGLDASLDPATDGLRNLTGKVNADGSVSLYAVTSTVSGNTDQGADPNKLVAISDILAFKNAGDAAGETFTTLQSAGYAEVLRGVAFAPAAVPEASSSLLLGVGLLGFVGVFLRKRAAKS